MSEYAKWHNGTKAGAAFSDDQRHRYLLWRVDADAPPFEGADARYPLFLMLNPSTATHEVNDPTVTRCHGFAKRWGYRRFQVCNLFSLRSTAPKALRGDATAEGGEWNLNIIMAAALGAEVVVCAWGVHGGLRRRDMVVTHVLRNAGLGHKLHCLGVTKGGHPRHPLYLPNSAPLELFHGFKVVTHAEVTG